MLAGGLALIALGRLRSFSACGWVEIAWLAALWIALAASVMRWLARGLDGRSRPLLDDLEMGSLLVLLAEAVALLAGGVQSPLYPLVYLVMAFLVAFLVPAAGAVLTGFAVTLDALAFLGLHVLASSWPDLVAHAGFLTLFAVLYQGVLAAQVLASRRAEGQGRGPPGPAGRRAGPRVSADCQR